LNELQTQIMRVMAEADGKSVDPSVLQRIVNKGALILDAELAALERYDLISYHTGGYGGRPAIYLTDPGRTFVIKAGYAPDKPLWR